MNGPHLPAAVVYLCLLASPAPSMAVDFPLRVSEDRRCLVDQAGIPFLVVGDTAWSLIAQLDEIDIVRYLDDRARRGFNSIIVSLIEHKFASRAPATKASVAPFAKPGDFASPNPAYFDFAHRALEQARDRGISVWLCPAYLGAGGGDEGFFQEIKAAGPDAFRNYGRFVGNRFRDLTNIIWMVGGDFSPPAADRWTGITLAEGLREGGAKQLMTAHGGQTSALDAFGDRPWLDVDNVYSYKSDLFPVLLGAHGRVPARPFVLIETTYEGEHDSRPEQIRRQAWWAMLSGACGQFFGNNPIWHFDGPTLFPFTGTWQEALDAAGSRDVSRLGNILAKHPWHDLVPDRERKIIVGDRRDGASRIAAARTSDGRLALVYVPADGKEARELTLDLTSFPSPMAAQWINPAKDSAPIAHGAPISNRAGQALRTPGDNGTGVNDWLLVLIAAEDGPIRVHPENPHYFEWRGKPTVLITSTEHYGAVLNPDFDYVAYLDTLQAAGLNLTRTVNGDFLESTSATLWRGGDQNPLAPREGRYLAPWARSSEPGYYFGGNKFDLDRWDESYFRRLKAFVRAANERGIVVEFNAFYVLYDEGPIKGSWVLHPLNARNNVNGVGNMPWHRYNTLADPGLVARQEALLQKTLAELNEFDNVYYEICDEPYFSGASPAETAAWQNRMIETFVASEEKLPKKHLIAVNFANGSMRVENPHPAISVFNFHYCSPPNAVPMNWDFGKPIVFDESAGNGGHIALDRRREAWAFLLSGGAGYDNLDPSFATDDPTGSGKVMQADGRYDCRSVRAQLSVLKQFIESVDFIHMRPNQRLLRPWPHSPSELFYALEQPGKSYVVYFRGADKPRRTKFSMDLPAGRWQVEWLTPRDGSIEKAEPFEHPGGGWLTETPEFTEDIALRMTRVSAP
jgi:hypothetical protein